MFSLNLRPIRRNQPNKQQNKQPNKQPRKKFGNNVTLNDLFSSSVSGWHDDAPDKYKPENHLAGDRHYKNYIGNFYDYDVACGRQFTLLFNLGLRETSKILDFGCGSLRAGRLLINFLNKNNYYGIEPNKMLVKNAIKYETGIEIIKKKNPSFSWNNDFNATVFNIKFDFIIAQSIFSHTTLSLFKKTFLSFIKSIKENGIICFTALENKMYPTREVETDTSLKWIYPECSVLNYDDIISFTEKYGHCTDIVGYHHRQTWFVFSKNRIIIDIIKKNRNNLTDLPLFNKKLWEHCNLPENKNKWERTENYEKKCIYTKKII